MAWYDESGWLSISFGPSITAIVITAFFAFTLPLLLHLYLYRSKNSTTRPTFLLLGPSGSGKTALLTFFERGSPPATHVSQTSLTVECSLPVSANTASSKFRSANDPMNLVHRQFLLVDTPGHGKLRHEAFSQVADAQNVKGVIFVVDATNLSSDTGTKADEGLTEAAQYLHDVLLVLQKRYTSSMTSKGPNEMPVLIAANKMDLFTALPAPLVKTALESEITTIRNARSKGLLDSGIALSDGDAGDETERLGDSEGKFQFKQMEEVNVPVEVSGGNVTGAGGPNVTKWSDWIGNHL